MTTGLPIPAGFQLPGFLQKFYKPDSADLSGGVGGLPTLSIRGRVFRFKYRGNETNIVDQNMHPLPFLDVIIVRAQSNLSKIYYVDAYAGENDRDAPDCASVDGITPDAGVPLRQSLQCATCPQNVWGSKTTPQGKQTKACADSRRLAIVPAWDAMNETYGGVCLMRVPPASLADLANYGNMLHGAGIPHEGVITRLSFDVQAQFPKLKFDFAGIINEDQSRVVEYWLGHEQTERIFQATPAPAVPPQPHQVQQPVAQPQPVYQPPVQPQPQPYLQQPIHVPPQVIQPSQPPVSPFTPQPSVMQPVMQPVMQQPQPQPAARPAPPPGWAWNAEGNGFVPAPQPAAPTLPAQPVMQQPALAPGQPAPPPPAAPATRRRGRTATPPAATQAQPVSPPPAASQPQTMTPPSAPAPAPAPAPMPVMQQPPVPQASPQPNGQGTPAVSAAPAELETMLGNILTTQQ